MNALSTLKLVAARKPQHMPTIQLRRNKLSNKLWEQIQLAKSQISGQPFVVTRFRSVKDPETGLRRQVEMPKRIRAWWFVTENGKVCVSIRYGSWTLELAKGKPGVEVSSDGRTAALRVPEFAATWCYSVEWATRAADGTPITGVLHGTLH